MKEYTEGNMNISERFVDFISGKAEMLNTEELVRDSKSCILDYLGCALAGERMLEGSIDKLLTGLGGTGSTPVIGKQAGCDPMSAALLNAMSAHAVELDDGHRYGMLHPGAPVISALISAASAGIIQNGQAFIKGVIIGYEVTCRLAQAIQPGHKLKGYHGTGTCGNIGAAMAIGIAAGFSRLQLLSTISAASTSASGLLEMIDDSSQLKPYNVGQAAMNGYLASCIGASGLLGPKDPLGGNRGFFKAVADEVNEEKLLLEEETFKIQQRYTKAYASCRHCHPAVEAALKLTHTFKLDADEIERINVYTYKLAIQGHDLQKADSISAAKMSTPFAVAAAIVKRKAGLEAFTQETIRDDRIRKLSSKVIILEDKDLTEMSPGKRAAIVEFHLKDGRILNRRVDYPLGEPENPMSEDGLKDKYLSLGRYSGRSDDELLNLMSVTEKLNDNLKEWLNLL